MSELEYEDGYIKGILEDVKTIALIGASNKAKRPSNKVMKYMLKKGYAVIPVNPGLAGQEIHGQTVVASLPEIEGQVDMVDIFRASEAAGMITDKAIELAGKMGIKAVWMQEGVRHDEAAARAEAAGLRIVMDHCPKKEFARLIEGRDDWDKPDVD